MTDLQISAAELKVQDPKRFDRAYWRWAAEHAVDYKWWEFTVDAFREKAEALGFDIDADKITFSIHGGQGDGAAFAGSIYIHEWMERKGLHEKYPALYLDLTVYRAVASTRVGRGYYIGPVEAAYMPGNCYPTGIFADLPPEVWDELVGSQWEQAEDEILDGIKDESEELAGNLHSDLTEEYEYLTSEVAYIENCHANDITFLIDEDN